MIRYHVFTTTPRYKRTRSRRNPASTGWPPQFAAHVEDVRAELRTARNAGAFEAGFAFLRAELFDAQTYVDAAIRGVATPIIVITEV